LGRALKQTDGVMARASWIAALTVSAALAGTDALAQNTSSGRRVPWWRNTKIQQELLLTDAQVVLLEEVFQRQLPARIALQRELERLDAAVQHVLDRGEPDDVAAMQVIERAEQLRVQQNIRRALMLLKMSKVLMPEQRVKLSTIVDRFPLASTR
jgi:Spy/CpxP family protein refolding chaperone